MGKREEDIIGYLVVQGGCIVLNLMLKDTIKLGDKFLSALQPVGMLLALEGESANLDADRFKLTIHQYILKKKRRRLVKRAGQHVHSHLSKELVSCRGDKLGLWAERMFHLDRICPDGPGPGG